MCSKDGAPPRTPTGGFAPWTPTKGGAFGIHSFGWGEGGADWGWPRRERQRKGTISGHLRIRAARFPQSKSLDTFDFNAQPSLNKTLVLELAHCDRIEQRQTCIALGPSGSSKAHIGLALKLVASGLNSLIVFVLNG